MNKNGLMKLIFIIIVTLQVLSCSSDRNDDVLEPDGNRNRRYLSMSKHSVLKQLNRSLFQIMQEITLSNFQSVKFLIILLC